MWWILGGVALLILTAKNTMAFAIKPGVYGTLHDVMLPALDAVQRAWALRGLTPTITSIEDGQHMDGSKHYAGLAFDIRLNDIPATMHQRLVDDAQGLAGDGYDFIHEAHGTPNDHLHVEFDPK